MCDRFGWDANYVVELLESLESQGYLTRHFKYPSDSAPQRLCIDFDFLRDVSHVGFGHAWKTDRLNIGGQYAACPWPELFAAASMVDVSPSPAGSDYVTDVEI